MSESIDDFLSNRLSEQESAALEQQAASDPALQADLKLQRQIIEGVRNARRLELKTMLNNVPMGGVSTSMFTAAKIAAAISTVAVVGSVVYFTFLKTKENKEIIKPSGVTAPTKREDKNPAPADKIISAAPMENKTTEPVVTQKLKESTIKTIPEKKSDVVAQQNHQPKIEVVDPSDEMIDSKSKVPSTTTLHKASTASKIAVDVIGTNKKYNFHYQFLSNKLILFGPFDKTLYEIIEINGDQKSLFLFYKDNYYLMSEKQNAVTRLEPIKDPMLIKKLKDYRGQ